MIKYINIFILLISHQLYAFETEKEIFSLIPDRQEDDGRKFTALQRLKSDGQQVEYVISSVRFVTEKFKRHYPISEVWYLNINTPWKSRKLGTYENVMIHQFKIDENNGRLLILGNRTSSFVKTNLKDLNDVIRLKKISNIYVMKLENIAKDGTPRVVTDLSHKGISNIQILKNGNIAFLHKYKIGMSYERVRRLSIYDINLSKYIVERDDVYQYLILSNNHFLIKTNKYQFLKRSIDGVETNITKHIRTNFRNINLFLTLNENEIIIAENYSRDDSSYVNYRNNDLMKLNLKNYKKTMIQEKIYEIYHVFRVAENQISYFAKKNLIKSGGNEPIYLYISNVNKVDNELFFVGYKKWSHKIENNETLIVHTKEEYGTFEHIVALNLLKSERKSFSQINDLKSAILFDDRLIATQVPYQKTENSNLLSIDLINEREHIIDTGFNFSITEKLNNKYVLYMKSEKMGSNQQLWLMDSQSNEKVLLLNEKGVFSNTSQMASEIFYGTSGSQLLHLSKYFPLKESNFLNNLASSVCELNPSSTSLTKEQTEAVSCRLTTDYFVEMMIKNFNSDISQSLLAPAIEYSTSKLRKRFEVKSLRDIKIHKVQFDVFEIAFEQLKNSMKSEEFEPIKKDLFSFAAQNEFNGKSFKKLANDLSIYDSVFLKLLTNDDLEPLGLIINTLLENWKNNEEN